MRKLFLVFLMAIIIFAPVRVDAATGGVRYYCDSKQDLGDGTFYMTCHIEVTSSEEVNHIKGELTLVNVVLESVKTYDDWSNLNGVSTSVELKAESGHAGSFKVADLLFTGDLSDTECIANFAPEVPDYQEPESHVCMIVDGVYYGEGGSVVTEEEYYEQCCNYTCTIIDDKYYFDSNGNSVTYEEMLEDCGETDIVVPEEPVENPQTGINYGYIILPIGIIFIIAILKIAKKNTKIYKI